MLRPVIALRPIFRHALNINIIRQTFQMLAVDPGKFFRVKTRIRFCDPFDRKFFHKLRQSKNFFIAFGTPAKQRQIIEQALR